jgi:predicted SprT family Zn-dependent metalloprotease
VQLEQARRLMLSLMQEFGLTDRGWTFKWDNARTRRGCVHTPRYGPGWITLSRVLIPIIDNHKVEDTMRHEIAHALAPGKGHGPEWKMMARRVGAKPERCYRETDPAQKVEEPWVGICPVNPEHQIRQHQQPVRVRSCGQCNRIFDPRLIIRDWTYCGRPTQPRHPKYVLAMRKVEQKYGLGIYASAASSPERPKPAPVSFPLPKVDRPVVGAHVEIGGNDQFTGLEGDVEKIGRTRYHVRITTSGSRFEGQLVTVPFILTHLRAPHTERD